LPMAVNSLPWSFSSSLAMPLFCVPGINRLVF
jgi:hypothetical protein